MAGIYIHVPFCGSRCIYCDFYSTTQGPEQQEAYVSALCNELSAPLPVADAGTHVSTVYFGGGTPSRLTPAQIGRILRGIGRRFHVAADAEVTLEMNSDDVEAFFSHQSDILRKQGGVDSLAVNRISLGVQTFDDNTLHLLRRRHDAAGAVQAVRHLQQLGFDNISIDLIYGLPGQSLAQWEHDLDTAFGLGIQHLSAYALSYEPGTPLWRMREQGVVRESTEEDTITMYQRLCQRAQEAGFDHYEISNFALPGFHSRHNSSYWHQIPYYGYGPGAHSYDGLATRWANHPSLSAYINYWGNPVFGDSVAEPPRLIEHLTEDERFDEFVMCGLRIQEGIDLQRLQEQFGPSRLSALIASAQPYLRSGNLALHNHYLHLTPQSLMISDAIIRELMA